MLEWTGERFLPWINESTIAYEHLHRYAYAATLVKDKRVLDLASGEGYGAKILAGTASSVVGLDIDANVIRHATEKYGCVNLQFLCGSITAIPIHDDYSFDVVVCFEALEHIADQDGLLAEVKRLLRPGGAFIASTPNKEIYRDESEQENPFHVKELDFEELQDLVGRYFRYARFLGQRIHPGSSIWPIRESSVGAVYDRPRSSIANSFNEFVVERGPSAFEFIGADKRVPLYFIVIASDSADALPQPGSVLIDQSDSLLAEKDTQLQASVKETKWREQQLADRDKIIEARDETIHLRDETIHSLEGAVSWRESQLQEVTKGLAWSQEQAKELEKTVASHEEALTWRDRQVSGLETALEHWQRQSESLTVQLHATQRQLAAASNTLAGIYASRGWKAIMKLRAIRDRLKGLVK